MLNLVFGAVLGALSLGFITLLVRSRSLTRQVDALRAEVAMARIEGVLAAGSDGAPPDVVRRKGHLGLVRRTGALAGLTVGALSWVRSHRAASSGGAVATAAVVAVGAVYLGGPESRRSEPAPTGPVPGAVLAPTLSPREPVPSSTPSAGPRPRSSRASAAPSPSAAAVADLTDLVSLLPVPVPVPVPSVPAVPSVDVGLAPAPRQPHPCVHARLGPAEAKACVTR